LKLNKNQQYLDDTCYENIKMMIYFIFMQYMNHRMQITQECSECDLMTNSVKFMQQTSSSLSEGDSSVCS